MFWGLIMEPQRRYTQTVKKPFHISMAALDASTSSEEPAQVMCGYEGRNYLLCTLKKPDVLQCTLNLNFDAGTEVSFAANGKCHIHLTGYLNEDFTDLEIEEEEEEEEEDEQTEEVPVARKRSKVSAKGPPTKKSKNGVVTSSQEVEQEEDENSDSDDLDYAAALLGKSLEDDDEDDSDVEVDEEEAEEEEEEGEELKEDDEDEEEEDEGEEEEESSLSSGESNEEEAKPKLNGLTPKIKKADSPKKQKAEKKKKQQQQQDEKKSPLPTKKEQKKEGKTPNKENQTPKKKVLQGGVIIEDIREGQGAPAKNGKFVNVYYEGRLKQNNKMFDSTTKGAGFSFRLGNNEVIKGWDVGVVGMKVGGKRKIICPPAMAYGQKGSPPAIPANSTLVFEVELKRVN